MAKSLLKPHLFELIYPLMINNDSVVSDQKERFQLKRTYMTNTIFLSYNYANKLLN